MHNLVYFTLAAGRYATSVELDSRGKTLLRGLILAVAFMLAANGVPAEQLRNVLGTIALEFVPAEGATAPEPPMDVILVMRRLPDGQQIRPRVADSLAVWDKDRATSHQNFRLTLPPGSYQILGIEILAPSLSGDQVPLPFGASFVVQDTGCVYLGRMRFEFLRLPAASFATSKDALPWAVPDPDLGLTINSPPTGAETVRSLDGIDLSCTWTLRPSAMAELDTLSPSCSDRPVTSLGIAVRHKGLLARSNH